MCPKKEMSILFESAAVGLSATMQSKSTITCHQNVVDALITAILRSSS
jgi:hypothetical protein